MSKNTSDTFQHLQIAPGYLSFDVVLVFPKIKLFLNFQSTFRGFTSHKEAFFFYLCFLLRTFTNHRIAEEDGGHFFNSSLPLPPASQTLRH